MPYDWVDPGKFFKYRGITIYYTYKNDDWNNRSEYYYTTDISSSDGEPDCIFDVRDLPSLINSQKKKFDHKEIIKNAIDIKLLKLPEGIKYKTGV